jgi:hypothetical protein
LPWDGVLLPYAATYTLLSDFYSDVYGPQGNSGELDPLVYQYLREGFGVANGQSSAIRL